MLNRIAIFMNKVSPPVMTSTLILSLPIFPVYYHKIISFSFAEKKMEQYYCLYCANQIQIQTNTYTKCVCNQTSLCSIQNAKHHVQNVYPSHELKVGHIKGFVDPKPGNYIKTTLNLD